MRDPMGWALTVFRAFGIPVRVHLFFFIVTLGLFLRQTVFDPKSDVSPLDVFLLVVVLFFVTVFLHELGHCFAARAFGGEANEIVLWPLGGLALTELPPSPRAHFWTAAAGPGTNAVLALLCAGAMMVGGFLPNLNPLANPYTAATKNFRDGRVYTSEYDVRLYAAGNAEGAERSADLGSPAGGKAVAFREAVAKKGLEWAVAPTWVVWLQRAFWINWLGVLINLLPAYPLDGGQMLYAFLWGRTSQKQAATAAGYSGYVVGVLILVASVAANESLLLGFGLFMLYMSMVRLQAAEGDDGPFGYDFSAGYTSLERGDEEVPARTRKKGGVFKRWLQARTARRIQREAEERTREDERMDALLEKIARSGKESLSDEERRFMERVSARYRNRS